ncbi:hypothetical protein HX13_07125 [Chryseobacterium sp. P1-3]|uniref:hypothetical protein n=1 Tax=Chryseobacterium sp. (strain P1-3) TaxID=1517683 RepID=UPI0004E605A5|nr:hypothetical protein [Chryseobacterium sp. P1-3]KFF75799.1 hypothetical protein HX13_07125 [Chryseobacterium sp. P1-3]
MKSIEEKLEDIAAGLSVPVERLKLIVDQIKSKDRMDGDDLRQLTDFSLPFTNTFAELVFDSPQTVNKMIKEGKVNFFLFTIVAKLLQAKADYFTISGKNNQKHLSIFFALKGKALTLK